MYALVVWISQPLLAYFWKQIGRVGMSGMTLEMLEYEQAHLR